MRKAASPFPMLAEEPPKEQIRPGMIVKMRRRMWRVESVDGDVLTATPIDDFGARPQKFLTELENPEPGTIPDPSLESLGDPRLQELFLRAMKLDVLHGTAPFMSIQRTAIIPVEYQLVPLVMALRLQPCRLLLADTTGLGKTVEAGLITAELLARGRARSVLIITPANLREQWKQQMRDLFYMEFEIMSSDTRKRLERSIPPGADPWVYFDKLILSIDYAKDQKVLPEIVKPPKWDIVIVDEAHNAAMPHGLNGRKADMDRWRALESISKNCQHLLLLTATPHNGFTDSYCSLLGVLSPDLVSGEGDRVRPNRARAVEHVCQRTRNDLRQWFEAGGHSYPFPKREPPEKTEIPIDLHRDYIRILAKLDSIMEFTKLHAEQAGRVRPVEWFRLHLHRRALSSPAALRQSLENRIEKLRDKQERLIVERAQAVEEDDEGTEILMSALFDKGGTDAESEGDRDVRADAAILRIEERLQRKYFSDLLAALSQFKPSQDRKLAALRDKVLPELFAKASDDTPAHIILFTRFKDTLDYLERELKRGADYEIVAMHGDLSEGAREKCFTKFAASPKSLLLATDVISEGLNLQSISCMVVHYDVPWNPNRLEQRTGRVDRFGQRAPVVYVRTLFCRDTTDEDVMEKLIRKLEQVRRDLGFSPPLFASEETIVRVLSRSSRKRTEASLFDAVPEEELWPTEAIERMRAEGFYGQADVKVKDVSDKLERVHRLYGSPEQIRSFIKFGLRKFNSPVKEHSDGTLSISIRDSRLVLPGVGKELEMVVLDPLERELHPDAIVLDVGHPLVRRLNAVIRQDALRPGERGARTAAHLVKGQRGTVLLGQGVLRLIADTNPPSLLEQIVSFGIRAGSDGFKALQAAEIEEALSREWSAREISREEALQDMRSLGENPVFVGATADALATAVHDLTVARSQMAEELSSSGGDGSWLQGFSDLETIGFDLFCLTLLKPDLS